MRNVYEQDEPSYRSQVGPALADLKPAPKPKPSYKAPSKPDTSSIAEVSSEAKSEPEPTSKPEVVSRSSDSESLIAKATSEISETAGVSSKVTKKLITMATPAADVVAKNVKAKTGGAGDLKKMKIAPRTLIASLEKYIPLEAEQLIGAGNKIDLDAADLEPVTVQVKKAASAMMPKTQKVIAKQPLDPADMPAIDPADQIAIEPGTKVGTAPPAPPSPAASGGQVQPLGMSFFERFALSTMIASENHLATVPVREDEPATKNVSTAGGDDGDLIAEPVIVEDPDAVKFQSNDIPASHVSPGLDEMVISSTSQTDFDLNDSEMAFIGNVQVKSPRFNLRSDKFIVHLKKDNSGMAYGEAIGNVVIEMRENGRPTGYSGLASNAVYHPEEGKIVLSGWPKIRQEFKEHVAITRDTKMVLYTDGRVKTIGRNRTIIRK